MASANGNDKRDGDKRRPVIAHSTMTDGSESMNSLSSENNTISDESYESDCEEYNAPDDVFKVHKHYTHKKIKVVQKQESSSSDEGATLQKTVRQTSIYKEHTKRKTSSILSETEYTELKKLKLIVKEGIRRYEEYIDSDIELDSEFVFKNTVDGIDAEMLSDAQSENYLKETEPQISSEQPLEPLNFEKNLVNENKEDAKESVLLKNEEEIRTTGPKEFTAVDKTRISTIQSTHLAEMEDTKSDSISKKETVERQLKQTFEIKNCDIKYDSAKDSAVQPSCTAESNVSMEKQEEERKLCDNFSASKLKPKSKDEDEKKNVFEQENAKSDSTATSRKDSSGAEFKRDHTAIADRKQRRHKRALLIRQESESGGNETAILTTVKSVSDLSFKDSSQSKGNTKTVKLIQTRKYFAGVKPNENTEKKPEQKMKNAAASNDTTLLTRKNTDKTMTRLFASEEEKLKIDKENSPKANDNNDNLNKHKSSGFPNSSSETRKTENSPKLFIDNERKQTRLKHNQVVINDSATTTLCGETKEKITTKLPTPKTSPVMQNLPNKEDKYESFHKLKESKENIDIAHQMERILGDIDTAIVRHGGSAKNEQSSITSSYKSENVDDHVQGLLSTIDKLIAQEDEEFTRSFETIRKSQEQMEKDREINKNNIAKQSSLSLEETQSDNEIFSPYSLMDRRRKAVLHNTFCDKNIAEIVEKTYCVIELDGSSDKKQETTKIKKAKRNTFISHAIENKHEGSIPTLWKEKKVLLASKETTKRLHARRNQTVKHLVFNTTVKQTKHKVLTPKERILQRQQAQILENKINSDSDDFVEIDATEVIHEVSESSGDPIQVAQKGFTSKIMDKVVYHKIENKVILADLNDNALDNAYFETDELKKEQARQANINNVLTQEKHNTNSCENFNAALIDNNQTISNSHTSSFTKQKDLIDQSTQESKIKNVNRELIKENVYGVNDPQQINSEDITKVSHESSNELNDPNTKTDLFSEDTSSIDKAVNPVCIANTKSISSQSGSVLFENSTIATWKQSSNKSQASNDNSDSFYKEVNKKATSPHHNENVEQELQDGNDYMITQQKCENTANNKNFQNEEETVIQLNKSSGIDNQQLVDKTINKNIFTIESIVDVIGNTVDFKQYLLENQDHLFYVKQASLNDMDDKPDVTELIVEPLAVERDDSADNSIKLRGVFTPLDELTQQREQIENKHDVIAIINIDEDDESKTKQVSNEVNIVFPQTPNKKRRTISFLFKEDQEQRFNSKVNIDDVCGKSPPPSPRTVSFLSVDDSVLSTPQYSTSVNNGGYLSVANIPQSLDAPEETSVNIEKQQWQYKIRQSNQGTCQMSIQVVLDSDILERFETETFEYKYLLKDKRSDGCAGEWVLVDCTTKEIEIFMQLLNELMEKERIKKNGKNLDEKKFCYIL